MSQRIRRARRDKLQDLCRLAVIGFRLAQTAHRKPRTWNNRVQLKKNVTEAINSIDSFICNFGGVAQLVEQAAHTRYVVGSTPTAVTKYNSA